MRQTICIYEYMAFNTRNLLSGIIAFLLCRIRILDALGINDAKTRLGVPSIFDTPIFDWFFLRPVRGCLVDRLSFPSRSWSTHKSFSNWETLVATSSTDTHFLKDRAPHKKPRTDQRFEAVFSFSLIQGMGGSFQIECDWRRWGISFA